MQTVIDGVNYGPLAQLIGKWIGKRGLDIAPDAEGEQDRTEFIDELSFIPAGPAENAEEQQLVALRYRHVVRKQENGLIFHDQIGHWIYEAATGNVMHSLTIPRGVSLLAGGKATIDDAKTLLQVTATAGSDTFGIVQSPFMKANAETKSFEMTMTIEGDWLNYRESTKLFIYGRDFDHIDKSELKRVTYDQD